MSQSIIITNPGPEDVTIVVPATGLVTIPAGTTQSVPIDDSADPSPQGGGGHGEE
jgi:hypothetical protein